MPTLPTRQPDGYQQICAFHKVPYWIEDRNRPDGFKERVSLLKLKDGREIILCDLITDKGPTDAEISYTFLKELCDQYAL